jgi:tripartite-type tricarboxylate transporter receptor subunit TctC
VCRIFALSLLLFSSVSYAQGYPTKPIRLVVPLPAGSGGPDLVARLVASKTGELIGQPMVVDNRPGATGIIAAEYVARSAPDGYVLAFGTPNSHALSSLSGKAPYDPVRDFTPIITLTDSVFCLVVHPSLPVQTASDLIEYLKRNPGKISYGSNGTGGTFHLATELFKLAAAEPLDIVHVPYKGTSQVITDLGAGRLQMAFTSVTGALPVARTGKAKVLAVLGKERFPGLPDTPSILESVPAYQEPAGWFIVFGPGKLPQAITTRLNTEMNNALRSPEIRTKIEDGGLEIVGNTPQQSAERLRRTLEVYRNAMKAGFRFE